MESSIETIINIFHQYSIRLRDPETLIRKELKQLVQKELPNFLKKQHKDEEAINEIMEDLDTNQDKQLSFEEFIMLVARLTISAQMHPSVNIFKPETPSFPLPYIPLR
ncbi:hypothetical protein MJG53_001377 [Ovis ammon polii x Ovis aries]|uniref:Protein S100 n=2 Tax=Ovis TaxID=9935 RepID=A0A836D8C7_SHEEP|nr:hypothetical protein JEQ12_000891 [Ovis aries]KAI4590328.1 hypothetical protein MJG53_001377 [Ovis ammon polii x Ovis aries]